MRTSMSRPHAFERTLMASSISHAHDAMVLPMDTPSSVPASRPHLCSTHSLVWTARWRPVGCGWESSVFIIVGVDVAVAVGVDVAVAVGVDVAVVVVVVVVAVVVFVAAVVVVVLSSSAGSPPLDCHVADLQLPHPLCPLRPSF